MERAILVDKMLRILKNHKITLIILVVGGVVGLIFYSQKSAVDVWRITYEFDLSEKEDIPEIYQKDTLLIVNNVLIRNYTGSIADTLLDSVIKRHEFKVYTQVGSSKDEVSSFVSTILPQELLRVIKVSYVETLREKRIILDFLLLGLLFGMVMDFILALKKQPSPQDDSK